MSTEEPCERCGGKMSYTADFEEAVCAVCGNTICFAGQSVEICPAAQELLAACKQVSTMLNSMGRTYEIVQVLRSCQLDVSYRESCETLEAAIAKVKRGRA